MDCKIGWNIFSHIYVYYSLIILIVFLKHPSVQPSRCLSDHLSICLPAYLPTCLFPLWLPALIDWVIVIAIPLEGRGPRIILAWAGQGCVFNWRGLVVGVVDCVQYVRIRRGTVRFETLLSHVHSLARVGASAPDAAAGGGIYEGADAHLYNELIQEPFGLFVVCGVAI